MGEPYAVWLARLFAEIRTGRPSRVIARHLQIKTRTVEFWASWIDRMALGEADPPLALTGPLWRDADDD